jgi:hypothetical protein
MNIPRRTITPTTTTKKTLAIPTNTGMARSFDQPIDAGFFGGCSSLLSQPIALSVVRGSGRSQSKHCNVRGPLSPGGRARTR